jgi:hypothetical protein
MTGLPVQVYPRSLWPRLDPDRLGPLGVMNGCVNRDVCGGFLGRFRELRRLERLVGYEVARLPPWVTCSSTGSVPPCILCPTAFSDTPRASDASFTVANPSGASSLRLPMGPPSVAAGRPTLTAEAPRCPTRTPGRRRADPRRTWSSRMGQVGMSARHTPQADRGVTVDGASEKANPPRGGGAKPRASRAREAAGPPKGASWRY